MNQIIITEELVKKRTDKLIAELFPVYPRAALHKLFASGHVKLNGEETKPGIKVRLGDKLSVDLAPLNFEIEKIELPVLYEDDNVLVVNKPSGVISHARGRFFDEPSVASFVRQRVAELTGERAGIVHRLDRATSGVMVCAKNERSTAWIQKQFADRKVNKTYLAIVQGDMPSEIGQIDMPIARNPQKPQTFYVHEDGKAAITNYKTISSSNGFSLLELSPQTGRTHQLRVHLEKLNHPIVGDTLYGGKEAPRLMLHAYKLELILPSIENIVFKADIPEIFSEYVNV